MKAAGVSAQQSAYVVSQSPAGYGLPQESLRANSRKSSFRAQIRPRSRVACCTMNTEEQELKHDAAGGQRSTDEYKDNLRQLASLLTPSTVDHMRNTLRGHDLEQLDELCQDVEAVVSGWHPTSPTDSATVLSRDAVEGHGTLPAAAALDILCESGGSAHLDMHGNAPEPPIPMDFYSYLRQQLFLKASDEEYEEALDTMGRENLKSISVLYNEMMEFASVTVPEAELTSRFEALSQRINNLVVEVQQHTLPDTIEDNATVQASQSLAARAPRLVAPAAAILSSGRQMFTATTSSNGALGSENDDRSRRAWGTGWARSAACADSHTAGHASPQNLHATSSTNKARTPRHSSNQSRIRRQPSILRSSGHASPCSQPPSAPLLAVHESLSTTQRQLNDVHGAMSGRVVPTDAAQTADSPVSPGMPVTAASAPSLPPLPRASSSVSDWLRRRPVDISLTSAFAWASREPASSSWPCAVPAMSRTAGNGGQQGRASTAAAGGRNSRRLWNARSTPRSGGVFCGTAHPPSPKRSSPPPADGCYNDELTVRRCSDDVSWCTGDL